MASTDYRLDLLTPIETGFRIGANIRARNDAKARALQDAEREARELEARKAQLAQQALYQDQLLNLRANQLKLNTEREANDLKYREDRLALDNAKLFLDALPKPKAEPTVSITTPLPQGGSVTRRVPASEAESVIASAPKREPKEELIEVEVVVGGGDSGQPRRTVKRRMTQAQYDEMVAKENASVPAANASVGNIIGKWNRETGFQRTTK